MKIQEANVQLRAQHEAQRSRSMQTEFSSNFRQVFADAAATTRREEDAAAARERVASLLKDLVDAIMAAVNGKKCPEKLAADAAVPTDQKQPAASERKLTWQLKISERLSESEKTTVCGSGQVKTSDGRAIDFSFACEMSRQYDSAMLHEESGELVLRDPLLLSFNGKAAELTGERVDFDLDADGCPESIPGLGVGCGFLVFDRNANGRADDGRELFGVASGDGFADLAGLDADGNGWIDENDPAFSQLGIWSGDGYASLAERGVGALFGGRVDAPFALKTAQNELLGQIRSAGLYLSEAGQVGLMQQVDLAVAASGPLAGQQPEQGQELPA